MAELAPEILDPIVKLIEEGKMPEWWTSYAAQISYNLQVHTKGQMLDKVTGLYPHEHPDSQRHVVQSYESITKGSIWKAINNIIRVFNNSSYNIQISDKTRSIIEEYQRNEGSFFSQFLESWIKYAVAEDPNGLCVTYPLEYTDDLYRYVCFKDIISITDEILIFKSYEESEKKIELLEEQYCREFFWDYQYSKDGLPHPNSRSTTVRTYNRRLDTKYLNTVFHVFTKTMFIRFFKDNPSQTEYQYQFIKFGKELDTLPYFENGGVEIEPDLYESFVQPFVPFGNLALMAHRNNRAVDLMFAYPRMSELQTECDKCNAIGYLMSEDNTKVTCDKCHGNRYITAQSPYKVYIKTADNNFNTDGKIITEDSVKFYTPDTGILNYAQEQPGYYLEKAEEAVFVQQKIKTGNVEAAKSKELDQEGLFAWLYNISKVLYGNLEMFLQYMENYNGTGFEVSVERPYSFAILSESEAFEALTTLLASNAPTFMKGPQIDNFINKFVSESSPVKRFLEILKKYDPLLYLSNEDIASNKGLGAIQTKELIRHVYAFPTLTRLYGLNPNLFEQEDDKIIEQVDKEIQAKYDNTKDIRMALNPILNQQVANAG
jgi:hypothetical protein